jgi:hypothetical protein
VRIVSGASLAGLIFALSCLACHGQPGVVSNRPPDASATFNEALPAASARLPGQPLLTGLASVQDACDSLVPMFERTEYTDEPFCDVEDVYLDKGGDWGFLVVGWDDGENYFPVIRTDGGWSVDDPVLIVWEGGSEISMTRGDISGQRLSVVPGHGEQLVIDIEATTIKTVPKHEENWAAQYPIEEWRETHQRRIVCVLETEMAWCTPAIITSRVEEIVFSDPSKSPRRKYHYTPLITFENGALVVSGAHAKRQKRKETDSDVTAYLVPAGSYDIAELLSWSPPSERWRAVNPSP